MLGKLMTLRKFLAVRDVKLADIWVINFIGFHRNEWHKNAIIIFLYFSLVWIALSSSFLMYRFMVLCHVCLYLFCVLQATAVKQIQESIIKMNKSRIAIGKGSCVCTGHFHQFVLWTLECWISLSNWDKKDSWMTW